MPPAPAYSHAAIAAAIARGLRSANDRPPGAGRRPFLP